MFRYLSANEVAAINSAFGLVSAPRDKSLLSAAVERPRVTAYYEQTDLAQQAAILIDAIAQAHAFIDANKRTATAAGLVFAHLNGWDCRYVGDADHDELGQLVVALVVHHTLVDDCSTWLRRHLVKIQSPLLFDAALSHVLQEYVATLQYLEDK